jgi:peptide/nickel transport system substrate-binding protein
VPEAATRLATLLTEEVHLSDVERAARAEATNKGMQIIPSAATGMQVRGLFGGQYYTEPEKMQAGNPLHEKKVRQALNKAINRQAIADVLLSGSEVLIPHLFPFHRTLDEALWPGIFNQEWLGRWDEMYGYDPEQARVLLAEAGYPEGFEVTFYLFPLPGLPEMPDIGQAIALDWEAIGVKPKLVNLEFPKVREKYRSQSLQTEIYLVRGGNPTLTYIPAYFLTKSTAHGYQKPELDALWDELGRTLAREDRAQVFQQMGDILYEEFGLIQLFALSSEIMVNPQYIAEYKFPGDISGFFTHLEQIKTVPQ